MTLPTSPAQQGAAARANACTSPRGRPRPAAPTVAAWLAAVTQDGQRIHARRFWGGCRAGVPRPAYRGGHHEALGHGGLRSPGAAKAARRVPGLCGRGRGWRVCRRTVCLQLSLQNAQTCSVQPQPRWNRLSAHPVSTGCPRNLKTLELHRNHWPHDLSLMNRPPQPPASGPCGQRSHCPTWELLGECLWVPHVALPAVLGVDGTPWEKPEGPLVIATHLQERKM